MKRYMKQVVSWLCVILMAVSMVVPVMAANDGGSSNQMVYVKPMVRNISFTNDTGNIVDDGIISLKMEVYNPSPMASATSSYGIGRDSYLVLDNGTECKFMDRFGLNNSDGTIKESMIVTYRAIIPDTLPDGKYKIKSVCLKYTKRVNSVDEVVAEKTCNLSDMENQKELEIDVATPAESNYPELIDFSYGNVKNPAIVNGDSSVTAKFVMTQKNKISGAYTHKAKNIIFTFKNDKNSFTTSCSGYKFNNEQYEWYPRISAPDDQTIAIGKYKLDSIKFVYDDDYEDVYTYDRLKKLETYKDIELNVYDSNAQNLGDIYISTNKQFSGDKLNVTIDDEIPTQQIVFYHKMNNLSNVCKLSVYLKNINTGIMYSGTSTVYTSAIDDNDDFLASVVTIGQTYSSGTYEVYSVAYETTDGLVMTYYNTDYSKPDKYTSNAKLTCQSDNKIEVVNNVNPDAVTRQNLKLLYYTTDTNSVSVKTNGNIKDRIVNFRIRINTSGAELSRARVVFKNGSEELSADLTDIISVNSNGTNCKASMVVPANQSAGTYKLDRLELVSDKGVITVNTKYKNLKIIVKGNDRITADEIGTTPKNTKVDKVNGVAKAVVELPKEAVSEEVLSNTDAAGKVFASESYEFGVESSVIPDNTTVEIGKVITGAIYDNVKQIAENNSELKNADTYRVFEINLVDNNNTKIDNNVIANGTVAITTTIPEGFDADKTVVYRVDDDGVTLIPCTTKAAGDGKVTFETNHFSTYIFALKSNGNGNVIKPIPNPSEPDDSLPEDDDSKLVASENNHNNVSQAGTSGDNNATQTASVDNGKAPNTGDTSSVVLLVFTMLCCGFVMAAMCRRKSER